MGEEIRAIAESEARDREARIAEFLKHPNPGVVGAACWQLGDLRARQYLPDLVALLKHSDPGVVNMAGAGIREMVSDADANLLDHVTPVVSHDFLLARISAVEVLGRIRSSSSTPLLIERLKSEDSAVRYYIVAALGEIGDRSALPALEGYLEEVRRMDHSSPHMGRARGDPPHPQLLQEAIERAISNIKSAT